MVEAKRARKAETPKQPSRHLRSSAPVFLISIKSFNLQQMILKKIEVQIVWDR